MKYSLNAGEWNSVFAVPSSVVDKYIKLAGGNSLKLLLFLLRHGGEKFSEEQLNAELGFKERGELEDAALFWIQRGIIRFDKDAENGLVSAVEVRDAVTVTETADKPKTRIAPKPVSVSSGEVAGRIGSDKEIEMLFAEAERLYARPLRQRENQLVISLVDHYGLPVGVALMLLNYCFKAGKTSPSYIQTVAADWSEEEINTIELANARILSLEKQNGVEDRLREAMEMTTKLSLKMRRYIKTWTDWGFDEKMIMLAYEKTIDQIKEWKPEYANKILESWKSEGISSPDAAEQAAQQRKQTVKAGAVKAGANSKSSFDMNNEMNKIINRYKSDS
ncbi:MAG: DnaD domain protein [Ruminococcaceae bacterium]|nr:DnaD domain protein [Oscillospiraceae bacterium]